jgi:hypothetical protein
MINPDHEDLYCNACIENFSCEACGSELNMYEGPLCDTCSGITDSDDESDNSRVNDIDHFHNLYQRLAPTTEEQMQKLTTIRVQLCEECKMPCEFIWCNDCGFN